MTPKQVAAFRETIFNDIEAERDRQDAKWGEQNHNDDYWLGIFVEEVGEVAKAVIERKDEEMYDEIIQAMAVLFSWLECAERQYERSQS